MRIIDNQKLIKEFICVLLLMMVIPFNIGAKEHVAKNIYGIAGETVIYENGDNPTVIIDENTPLSRLDNTWSVYNLLSALASSLIGFIMLFKRRKNDDSDYYKYKVFRIMAIVTGLLSLVIFVLTESITSSMVLFDDFSILMTVLLLINIIIMITGNTFASQSSDVRTSH